MAEKKSLETLISNLEEALQKCKNKDFNVYFCVYDTQGKPSGSLEYIYKTAYQLQTLGYNVTMLFQLSQKEQNEGERFIGPGAWINPKYASLKHLNIEQDNVEVGPADFLFIPDVFSDVMEATKALPCKRVAILENFNYIQTFMPYSATWNNFGIRDVIATTNRQKELLGECFPGLNTRIVRPSIEKVFVKESNPQEMTVNIVSRDMANVKRVVALFYWKYPMFKWVSFNELHDLPQQEFADALAKSPFTVWIDEPTNFGYSALEAMRAGSIVIGKVPEETPEWLIDQEGNIANNGLWFNNINDVHKILAGAINAWINDEFPDEYQKIADETVDKYSEDRQLVDIENAYVNDLFANREKELVLALTTAKKNLERGDETKTNKKVKGKKNE